MRIKGAPTVTLMGLLMISGCTQIQLLPYLDQALLLKSFGQEKDSQHKYVENIDANFDKLLAAIGSGEIKKYKTEQDIIKIFGPPVLVKTVQADGKALKKSLYRYAIFTKGPHKVYFYYDEGGRLIRFESL